MYLEFARSAVNDLLAHAFDEDEIYEHYARRADRAVRKARAVVARRSDPQAAERIVREIQRFLRGVHDGRA